jgi:hypothetical protein
LEHIMKTILAALLGIPLIAGLASHAGAADSTQPVASAAIVNVAAADYDDPPFGSPRWWQQEGDRG